MNEQNDLLKNIENEQKAQRMKLDDFIELSSKKINNIEKTLCQIEETLRLLLANNLLNAFDKSADKSNKEGSGSVEDKKNTKTLSPDSVTDDKKKIEEQFSSEELCNKGYEAKNNEDYKTAFEYFKQAHKKGYILATVAIGDMYRDGNYVSQNYSKAFELYNYAAMKNDTNAMVRLFFAYQYGKGVPQNSETGKKWLERASGMGSGLAMSTLVELYCGNYGFAPDYNEAKKWNKKLRALSGYVYYEIDALNALGNFCRNNHNYVEALKYYKKSADYGDANAMCWLGNFYDNGWGTKKNDLLAKEWYEKAADGGNVAAMYNLGCMYRYGRPNITQNYKEARKWYRKAAENGFPDAMTSLGYMYHNGEGVKLNYDEAIKWYKLAIQSDEPNTTAMCNLAFMYENGEGVNTDLVRARTLYIQAYGAGDDRAKEDLERMGFTKRELIVIKIRYIICEQLGLEYDEVRMESEFINDLGADSLDIVELIMAFEEEFNIEIPDEVAEDFLTVKDVVNYLD